MTVRIINGDCREKLATLPDASVHCVVTSPPYWGLRDYGVAGQIGLERSPDEYVAEMVAVFREVRRVLRDDGTLWLNLGDSYSRNPAKGGSGPNGKHDFIPDYSNARRIMSESKGSSDGLVGRGDRAAIPNGGLGLKEKDLIGIPWMVAFALRGDGWWLRSDIIWSKPNPMPESVTDRPTSAHEHVFLLTKSARYFYDAEAVREPSDASDASKARMAYGRYEGDGSAARYERTGKPDFLTKDGNGFGSAGRNARNVWSIATAPFSEAHFACVDDETECLTAAGWKRRHELAVGDVAAQFNVDTGLLSWGFVQEVAAYEVTDQEMVVGLCRDLDMWLTPNHRTVIQRRHPHTRQKQAPTIIRADQLKAGHSIPTAAAWDFDGDASLTTEWAELLGWYVAEGHESKDSLAVELYQSETANAAKCTRIENLLRQVGVEWTKASCRRTWRGREAISVAYRIMGYAAVRLRELAPGKRLPWGTTLWARDRIESLLDGLIEGDGHTRTDGRRCFVQKDMDQCGLVQALAMRVGLSAAVSQRSDGIGTVWLTSHNSRSFRGTNGRGSPPDRRLYTGTVWCPRLPLGTWVARRNGRAFITGNTFPPELAERCIKAGTSEKGCCADCGAPWVRVVERLVHLESGSGKSGRKPRGKMAGGQQTESGSYDIRMGPVIQASTTGWAASCQCNAAVVPCTVLDPFAGAFTTALVADRLRRHAIGIELNPDYCEMAERRLVKDAGLFADIK